jgi:peptidoglycan/LPS O-acetylase OafA/YrhL
MENLENAKHQNNFDFMRLMGSFFVAYTHSFDLSGKPGFDLFHWMSNDKIKTSTLGVIIFFVVSGYLVTQSLVNSKSSLDFLLKRFLRIFPGFAIAILSTAFVLGPIFSTTPYKEYLQIKSISSTRPCMIT